MANIWKELYLETWSRTLFLVAEILRLQVKSVLRCRYKTRAILAVRYSAGFVTNWDQKNWYRTFPSHKITFHLDFLFPLTN